MGEKKSSKSLCCHDFRDSSLSTCLALTLTLKKPTDILWRSNFQQQQQQGPISQKTEFLRCQTDRRCVNTTKRLFANVHGSFLHIFAVHMAQCAVCRHTPVLEFIGVSGEELLSASEKTPKHYAPKKKREKVLAPICDE